MLILEIYLYFLEFLNRIWISKWGVTFAVSKGIYTKLLTKIKTTAKVMTEVKLIESFVKRSSLFSTTFEISFNLEDLESKEIINTI